MATYSPAESLGLHGRFAVRAEAGADGVTVLRRGEVSAPFHLSKPYWTGDVLVVQAVNATAGVFAGDRLALEVRVEPGARVLLTSPSAARIHTMAEGRAEQRQQFHVARGGWLEVLPELFIPQAGCRYQQRTEVDVEPGGTLFFVETLAPGRVARGEVFAFNEVGWALDIRRAGRLLLRERYTLRGGRNASTWSLRHPFPAGYYASCCVVADALDGRSLRAALETRPGASVQLGLTQVDEHAWLIKLLAADSASLRETLLGIRQDLVPLLPLLRADARKL
jgi:urease accessory protein